MAKSEERDVEIGCLVDDKKMGGRDLDGVWDNRGTVWVSWSSPYVHQM